MYDVEWFTNRNTHGTYTRPDFLEDISSMSVDELCALRRYQMENLNNELFYEHVWGSDTIEYRSFK